MNKEINSLYEEKWYKLKKLIPFFRFIPFVEFVLVSGSMALGNINKHSDFDVIVGVKHGRIFTTRLFCFGIFSLLNSVRREKDSKEESSDKMCFNHFITPKGYKLSPPYNLYWQDLYSNLIPVYGDIKEISNFFNSNNWLEKENSFSNQDISKERNIIAKSLEIFLSGKMGDYIEKVLKNYQKKRINRSIKMGSLGHKPLLVVDDSELRFHIDTKRIEEYVNKKES